MRKEKTLKSIIAKLEAKNKENDEYKRIIDKPESQI